ncbi:3'-5' exonuclease [Caldimonas tepidiphila]|uniref:3'-5' exonuclease n=1 Tax=Caldimonas tepidiphila TaxID=2315841 RepID=UPI000E5B1278|nr:3'-5' exonuclease [Caldimonas tepidiphila]
MALFPQGLTNIDRRCNAGERKVLHQLKRCLEDDYLVWHDVPVGPRARQPDFVILSPRWGVLLLEVKDWRLSTLGTANRDSVELQTPRGVVTAAHPLRQARDYALELADVLRNDPALTHAKGLFRGKLLLPWGYGAVLSNIKRADTARSSDFFEVFPEHKTLLHDDLDEGRSPEEFLRRLWGMAELTYPHTLTLPQRDRVRWHLFPEVRVQAVQGALDPPEPGQEGQAPLLPDLLQVMDLQQEQIARTLGEGHRVIHGAAGSGKTMILVFRAQHLAQAARPEQPALVLCYNRALALRIEALLRERGVREQQVQVRTFHAWCEDLVRSYRIDVPVRRDDPGYYDALAQAVTRAVETGRVPGGQYLALLVDEAHDFEDAWLRVAAQMVSPATNSLLVLYDDAQSIYQKKRRRFNFKSVGIEAQGRTSILKLNYRNTAEILALAMHCASGLLEQPGGMPAVAANDGAVETVLPASAGRRGPLPVLLQARSEGEEAQLVAERIAQLLEEGCPASGIAVLARFWKQMDEIEAALSQRGIPVQRLASLRRGGWRTDCVKLVTLHSSKGLEFPHVFIAGLQALPYRNEPLEEEIRLLYVGMTRATQTLVLSATRRSVIVDRVRSSLDVVAQQFRAA